MGTADNAKPENTNTTQAFFVMDMMITEIRSSDPSCNWVWREPTPNSSQKTKLTAILRGGEKTETAKNLIRHVQTEQEKIAAEGFWVDWGD